MVPGPSFDFARSAADSHHPSDPQDPPLFVPALEDSGFPVYCLLGSVAAAVAP